MAIAIETADLEEVCRAAFEKRAVDPVIAKRVRERADAVRNELRKSPPTDVAVALVREVRDE